MKEALHTMIGEGVASWLGWPDAAAVGRGSALPDQIETFDVPGIGARFAGCNISSLGHFSGYCLNRDPSLRIELPNVDIRYNAGAWPEIPLDLEQQDPLFRLLNVQGYTKAFDEITFPSAWSFAEWLEACFLRACESTYDSTDARGRDRRLGTLAGMALHYVQDMCVPHHRHNMLLRGHAKFELLALRRWESLPASMQASWINDESTKAARWSARGAAQGAMAQAGRTPGRWYCLRIRQSDLDKSIRQCIRCTAAVLKQMKEYL